MLVNESLAIFNDPVKLAAFSVEPLKSYLENRDQLPLPTSGENVAEEILYSESSRRS